MEEVLYMHFRCTKNEQTNKWSTNRQQKWPTCSYRSKSTFFSLIFDNNYKPQSCKPNHLVISPLHHESSVRRLYFLFEKSNKKGCKTDIGAEKHETILGILKFHFPFPMKSYWAWSQPHAPHVLSLKLLTQLGPVIFQSFTVHEQWFHLRSHKLWSK